MTKPAMTKPDIDAARHFLAASARIVDRRRFEAMFDGGPAAPVRAAVAAYRNPDGGFGNALEPDVRSPGSQPAAIDLALRILDESGAWQGAGDELVTGACDWLQAHAPAGGGSMFVEPTIDGWPHAPWWVPPERREASLISTGMLAGTLHARGVTHPWLTAATELLWSRIDTLTEPQAYEMLGVFRFLDGVPDRDRAAQAARRAGQLLLDGGLVELDPEAPGETHSPLDYAPLPGSAGRAVFGAEVIERHLDHLASAQRDDGGWTFNWMAWSPAAEQDWRGFLTVSNVALLRANGRC
jgi:hypothetical protein